MIVLSITSIFLTLPLPSFTREKKKKKQTPNLFSLLNGMYYVRKALRSLSGKLTDIIDVPDCCTHCTGNTGIVPGFIHLDERLSSLYTTSRACQARLIPTFKLGNKLDIMGDHVRHCLA